MSREYIGIDMGTSGMKLLIMNGERKILSQSSIEYETSQPHKDWSETDPDIWFNSMITALHSLLEGHNAKDIRAIGVTGQMHTLIVLGDDGKPLRPAMMWNDKRTSEIITAMKDRIYDKFISRYISTGSPAANLYWLKLNEPDMLNQCRNFLIGPDYLTYRLTGNKTTDFSGASTSGLYSINNHSWSDEVRELIGLHESIYPEVKGSTETAGYILPEIADEFGLSHDVKVITGTGDNPASAVSTGCIVSGYPVLSLGTSGVLMFPVNEADENIRGKVILYSPDKLSYSYLIQGVVQSTGEAVNWWTRKILRHKEFGGFEGKINDNMIKSSRILFYPHINGDKTIYSDPELKGAFMGLDASSSAEEMYYAVIEGLCFAVRELAEYIHMPESDALRVVGGGSKSSLWMKVLSSVMNIRVERLSGITGPAYGAAILAGASDYDYASSVPETDKIYTPEKIITEHYNEKYKRYLKIHDALKFIA